MAQGVTIASTTVSTAIDLNPNMRQTVFQVVTTAGSSGTSFIQVTLDDLAPGTTQTVSWATLSSAINSSAADGVGQALTILSPISGARLSVQSSTTTGIVGSISMRVLQSITA